MSLRSRSLNEDNPAMTAAGFKAAPQRKPLLASIFRALGSLLPRRRGASEESGAASRVIHPWREDSLHTYPVVGLKPSGALALLQTADSGSPAQLFELFHEMLQRWPRLAAVEATRRLALTGLDWEIVAADSPNLTTTQRDLAERAADLCRRALAGLEAFDDALAHLAQALGHGLSVAELVWEDGALVDVVPAPYSRLISDPHEPWRLRIRTADEPALGVALDEQPHKWLIHSPRPQPGRPFDAGLLRASLLLFLSQNLSFKDWLVFSQIAGMPLRVARFEPGTPEEEKQQTLKMLQALGTDAVAAFSKNVELLLLETGRGREGPYRSLQDYCNTEITILWLGQHLTTDIRNSGSRAAAEVHDRVREDLLVQDIADEGRTIRRDLLTPLVRSQLGADAPVPRFRRSLVQSVDTKTLADTLAVAVNELGMAVPTAWAHQSLGIPQAEADAAIVSGRGRA